MKTSLLHLFSSLALMVHASTAVKNATYDDLTEGLTDTPLGTYKGLVYQAIFLGFDTQSIVAVGGVASASPPNRAITSVQQQASAGTASFTVAPPYKSLGLLDFFFGCSAQTGQGSVAVAAQCTITVAGFARNNDQEVAVASFTFTPSEQPLTPVPMIYAVLPDSFHGSLYNVTLAQSSSLVVVLLDNMHYSLST